MSDLSYEYIGSGAEATVSTTVVTLTAPSRANAVMIQNVDASDDARFTIDGTAPTSSHGFLLLHSAAATPNTNPQIFPLPYGKSLKLIRAASADVSVVYQYLKIRNRF